MAAKDDDGFKKVITLATDVANKILLVALSVKLPCAADEGAIEPAERLTVILPASVPAPLKVEITTLAVFKLVFKLVKPTTAPEAVGVAVFGFPPE